MGEQYTPDEDEVRNLYVNHCDPAAVRDDDFAAEFDRWLAIVRADAWGEGWKHAGKVFRAKGTGPRTRNPYRP